MVASHCFQSADQRSLAGGQDKTERHLLGILDVFPGLPQVGGEFEFKQLVARANQFKGMRFPLPALFYQGQPDRPLFAGELGLMDAHTEDKGAPIFREKGPLGDFHDRHAGTVACCPR
jgi:hypothetical protein